MEKSNLILVNPWIYDFAAFDLWSKPLGLFYLAGYLRQKGFQVHLIDCLDIHYPGMQAEASRGLPRRRPYGIGKYWRERVARPGALKGVPRPYHRYGITPALLSQDLKKIKDPQAILVTSLMTYWYPGVLETIRLVQEIHPGVPVVLGGLYARLCHGHAKKFSHADLIVQAPGFAALAEVEAFLGQRPLLAGKVPDWEQLPYPAFDLLSGLDYVPLLTSLGCSFHCQYCASHFLHPRRMRREPLHVLEEILFWHGEYGVRDFAFYDDALLLDFERHLALLLEEVIKRDLGLRFHTPNALHVREINAASAGMLFRSGFRTIRLGLETSDMELHQALDGKVGQGEFERGVGHLKQAGFTAKELGAYVLLGLPGQTAASVKETVAFVHQAGAACYLAEYSPLPHTALWPKARAASLYDLEGEPLFQNNTLLPCWDESAKAQVPQLKRMVKEFRGRERRA